MKKVLRLISLLVATIMVLSTILGAVPAFAVEESRTGLTFASTDLYAPEKHMEEAPNTFEAWINIPEGDATRSMILSNRWTGSRMYSFDVNKGIPRISVTEGEEEDQTWSFSEVKVNTGEWVHLAIVKDPAAKTVSCYVNGELKQTLTINGEIWDEDVVPGAPLCLGGEWYVDTANYFKGTIGSVAVFSTSRTAAEIAADMTSVDGAAGLMTYYDLSGLQPGDDIPDRSYNGFDIKYRENYTWIDATDKEPVSDYAYAIAVLGDTQGLNIKFPDEFDDLFTWIADNADEKKIEYVIGLGDMVDTIAGDEGEWQRAYDGYHSLDGKVDYSIIRGNHDKATFYNEKFPWSDFENTHTGSYDGTMLNTYRLTTIGEVKYLILNLDFGPSDAVLEWAGNICDMYPDYNVIVNTHAYLYINDRPIAADDHCPPVGNGGSNNGDAIWEKFISQHNNISLVLCGHETGTRIAMYKDKGVNGNTVTSVLVNMSNTEEASETALGMVALLYFSEDGRNVEVEYYSTLNDQYFRSINQFSFDLQVVEDERECEECDFTSHVVDDGYKVEWATNAYYHTCTKCGAVSDVAFTVDAQNIPTPIYMER